MIFKDEISKKQLLEQLNDIYIDINNAEILSGYLKLSIKEKTNIPEEERIIYSDYLGNLSNRLKTEKHNLCKVEKDIRKIVGGIENE